MRVIAANEFNERTKADCLIIPFFEGKKGGEKACSFTKYHAHLSLPFAAKDFHGKKEEILFIYHPKRRILLVGLGKKNAIDIESLRQAMAQAVQALRKKGAQSIELLLPTLVPLDRETMIRGIAEGAYLANYGFERFKKEKSKPIEKLKIIGLKKNDLPIIKKVRSIVSGVNVARDLVNNNADIETPQRLSVVAKTLEEISPKMKVTVFDKKAIEKQNMGLLLAVSRGSSHDPRFIIMSYQNNPGSKDHTVLVGKGITYDTGGLSLKPSAYMDTMKSDMSGAAAVIGAMHVLATLGVKANVTGIFPATENAIGPYSYKPGDVYQSMSQKTVEVINTDAEGRLILADALSYAAEKIQPTRIIDIASLTGAIAVALGEDITGLFCNNDRLAKQIQESSLFTGEKVWRMPLVEEYKKHLKSPIADLKNIGDRKGSSITAALFLEEFVSKIPWAHLDIGGSCYYTKPRGYYPTSATGVGVRLLVDLIELVNA